MWLRLGESQPSILKALEISVFSMVTKEIKKGNIERASSLMNVLSTNNLNGLSVEGDRIYSYERQDPLEVIAFGPGHVVEKDQQNAYGSRMARCFFRRGSKVKKIATK